MQGVSVVVSSGDDGVAAPPDDDDPLGCIGPRQNIFNPGFPVNCPYITTVGSTFLPAGANYKTDAEVATSRFSSGGGFSNIYPRPQYQAAAVAQYFAAHDPGYPYYESIDNNSIGAHGGIYNRIGRGYPDVAAIGDNVLIFGEGKCFWSFIQIPDTNDSQANRY